MLQEKQWVVIVLVSFGITLCGPVAAQKLYRCGSTFQDRPCDGESGKVVGNASTSAQASSNQSVDSDCAQRGADAQKIMWAREYGKTAEVQLASATSAYEKRVITDVYRKRGSSVEVRAAIEAECVAEKEKAMQAAVLNAAAAKLQGQTPPPTATLPSGPSEAEQKAALRQQKEEADAREAANKKSRCDNLNSRADGIRAQQRAGGSVATMDSLSRQQQDLDKSRRDAGC